jgi:hypothetical protein
VYIDLDADGAYTTGEPIGTTGSDGGFVIDELSLPSSFDETTARVVLLPGASCIDLDSSTPQLVPFIASADSEVMNPITTLVASLEEEYGAGAQAAVLSALGLSDLDSVLRTYDPYYSLAVRRAPRPARCAHAERGRAAVPCVEGSAVACATFASRVAYGSHTPSPPSIRLRSSRHRAVSLSPIFRARAQRNNLHNTHAMTRVHFLRTFLASCALRKSRMPSSSSQVR